MRKTLTTAAAALTLAATIAACGSSSSTSPTNTGTTAATTTTSTTAATGPGAGKPPVTLGDKNFTEQFILGALYQQALQAKGYKVTLKSNIGSSELTYKALQSGQIEGYPEYTGTLLTAIANATTLPTSAEKAYQDAKAYLEQHGYTMTNPTPFFDSDALAATKAYATAHHLVSIANLKPLGTSVKLGGLPEFRTRAQALVGLKQAYGIDPTFVPLASGLFYNALDSGQVNVSDVFTTDPQLGSGKYAVLSDPRHVFGFQNVALIIKKSVLDAEGPAFADTVNKVSSLLTTRAIIAMNAAVALNKEAPAAVAHQFLAANGLL